MGMQNAACRGGRVVMAFVLVGMIGASLSWSSAFGKQQGPATHLEGPQVAYLFGSGSTHGGRPITLRVTLTAPAPDGGANVTLNSERPDIILLPGTVTVPEGASEHTFQVGTVPAEDDTYVRVSASFGGRTVGREILIREPRLRALYVQQVIRGGGQGKVTVCLTGPSRASGTSVELASDKPAILQAPLHVNVLSGRSCRSIAVPATAVEEDVAVQVTASYPGRTIVKGTIVRDLGEAPTPSATPTNTAPAATATPSRTATGTSIASTATSTATATATLTSVPPTQTATHTSVPPTGTATATPTHTSAPPTSTFTPTATATSTHTPVPPTATSTPTATATTSTEGLSPGCALFATGAFDAITSGGSTLLQNFNAGERIQVSVSNAPADTSFTFTFDRAGGDPEPQSAPVPGTVLYVVGHTEIANTFWSTTPNGAVATWDFSCLPPLP
jgi:hypothetical protein